ALGLLHEVGMAEGMGAGVGAAGAWARATGASAKRAGLATGLSIAVTAASEARPSVGVAWAGAGVGMGLFCKKIAPNTATHSQIARRGASVARRMPDLQKGGRPSPTDAMGPSFGPPP